MTARNKIIAGLLLLAALVVVAWQFLRPREPDPIFERRRLSYWLGRSARTESFTAQAAVRNAGTNAIPMLLRFMRAHDTAFKRRLIALLEKQDFVPSPFISDDDHSRAVLGFEALGPEARSAVPELLRIYQTNPSADSRIFVIEALSAIGPGAKETIPLLLSEAANPDANLRMTAIHALGRMRVQPEAVVPMLIKSLSNPNHGVEWYAVEGLGNFGPQAKAAVPRLLELRQSLPPIRNSSLREEIDSALQKIDPAIVVTNAGPAR